MKNLMVVAGLCASALLLLLVCLWIGWLRLEPPQLEADAAMSAAYGASLRLEIERQRLALDREQLELERTEWENSRQLAVAEGPVAGAAQETASALPKPEVNPQPAPEMAAASPTRPVSQAGELIQADLAVPQTDYSLFYEELRAHGNWFATAEYGFVWQPHAARQNADWKPYTLGQWSYTDSGWAWCSDEPFGWAVYHYGRWDLLSGFGWIWVPGKDWAPAWVSWRVCPSYIGWAPLPAVTVFEVYIQFGQLTDSYCGISPQHYTFVPAKRFGEPAHRHCLPRHQNAEVFSKTVNVTRIHLDHDTVFAAGPNPDTVRDRTGKPFPRCALHRVAWTPRWRETAPSREDPTNLAFPAPRIRAAQPGAAQPSQVAGRIAQVRPAHRETRPDTELVQRFARERAAQERLFPHRRDPHHGSTPPHATQAASPSRGPEERPAPRSSSPGAVVQGESRQGEIRGGSREPSDEPLQRSPRDRPAIVQALPIPHALQGTPMPDAHPVATAQAPSSSLPAGPEHVPTTAQPALLEESRPGPAVPLERMGRNRRSDPLARPATAPAPGPITTSEPSAAPAAVADGPAPRPRATDSENRRDDGPPPRHASRGPGHPHHPAPHTSASGAPSPALQQHDGEPLQSESPPALQPIAAAPTPSAATPSSAVEISTTSRQANAPDDSAASKTETTTSPVRPGAMQENGEAAQQQAEATRKAQEEEAQRQAESMREAQEEVAQRQAESMRKAQEEAQRQAESMRKAQEEVAQRQAEATRKAQEEEAQRQAEARRAQEESQRQAEARRAQEEAQRQAEAMRRAQEEAQRQAEAMRKAQEEAQRQAEAAKKQQE